MENIFGYDPCGLSRDLIYIAGIDEMCSEERKRGNGVRIPCCPASVMETKAFREPLIIDIVAKASEIVEGKAEGENSRRSSSSYFEDNFLLTTQHYAIAAACSRYELLEIPFYKATVRKEWEGRQVGGPKPEDRPFLKKPRKKEWL